MGATGTGKTGIVRWILENNFKDISAYINCWKHRTIYEVLKEILLNFQIPVHGKEPTSELLKKLEKIIGKKKVIVCLDEVDRLKDFDVLYLLKRNNYGLILVSTFYHSLTSLGTRIKNSLVLTEIEFPAYSSSELFNILKDRVELAFRPRSIKDGLIKIAALSAQGDARVGLEILKKASKKAEIRNLKEIGIREVEEAISEANRFKRFYPIHKLNEHQKRIYGILEKKRKMTSGSLYREYQNLVSNPVVDRAYRNYMKRMVELGLVKVEGKRRWKNYEIIS